MVSAGVMVSAQRPLRPLTWFVAALVVVVQGVASSEPLFVDVGESSGLIVRHDNGMQGQFWLLEVIGAGGGLLDYDDDGRLDVWLVQSNGADQLYRNVSRRSRLVFKRVDESVLSEPADGYGVGVAVADVDNDNDMDVFLANYGRNQLYVNDKGRFRRKESGLELDDDWSVAGSFADFDGDGLLDLYVVNYVDWSVETHKVCHDMAGRPDYCAPEVFPASADRLYRNLGEGRFEDISDRVGLSSSARPGLGVVARDFNGDGRPDFFVANDADDNQLWLNQNGRTLMDDALLSGVAVNGDGEAEASMGVSVSDFDRDCDLDLFMTHLAAETNTLYRSSSEGWFSDATNQFGLGVASTPFTGFGTHWIDADNDGDLDVYTVNGAVSRLQEQILAGVAFPLEQPNQLWINEGSRFTVTTDEHSAVGRGLSIGDIDNDGNVDMLVTNNSGEPRLLQNNTDGTNHWIGFRLDAPGALIMGATVSLTSRQCVTSIAQTDGSYASASDHRVLFGLGDDDGRQNLRVQWADGMIEAYDSLKPDRYHVLRYGDGAKRSEGDSL